MLCLGIVRVGSNSVSQLAAGFDHATNFDAFAGQYEIMSELFLPGVPENLVRQALDRAGGNELASGKFASHESSAALAVNGFGWFIERPALLPPFPNLDDIEWPPMSVEIERQMRFPWNGGRHPWLDAAVVTESCLIGNRPISTAADA